MKDDCRTFVEELCSVVTLAPKWPNTKFVYLLQPSTILVMYTLVLTVNRDVDVHCVGAC